MTISVSELVSVDLWNSSNLTEYIQYFSVIITLLTNFNFGW